MVFLGEIFKIKFKLKKNSTEKKFNTFKFTIYVILKK